MVAAHEVVFRKFKLLGNLSDEESRGFSNAIESAREINAGVDLHRDGSSPEFSTCILSGFACRHKGLENGRRQILAFQIAGDISDLHGLVLRRMNHSVTTLSACSVASIQHSRIDELTDRFPNLARVLWRDTMMESSISREWLTGIGRRAALGRVAHLLCEQFYRMRSVGLADGNRITLPITQTDLADALGLSLVHANRTLQQLRALALIELKSKTLTILDWERLKSVAGFESNYLDFSQEQPLPPPVTVQ